MNITLLCVAATTTLHSQIIYVKPNGTGDGSSWANAMGDLRQAISNATFYKEIWVAKGIYTPTKCTNCTTDDRKISFELPNGVDIYGGFEGVETSLEQRNWERHPTILSGDINGDNDTTQNSYNLFYLKNVNSETIIDGFTLTQAHATYGDAVGERYTSGAAIYNDGRVGGYANPIIRNCIFKNNYARGVGGAVFNNGSFNGYCEATFKNCQFINNASGNGGGAVCNWGVFNSTNNSAFEFCRFINNHSQNSGGAVLSDAQQGRSEIRFIHCQFIKNTTDLYGGGIYNLGKGGNCTPTVTNCLFWGNKAFSAAGIYCLGSEQGNSSPRITNCIFYANEAMTGGSVYANAGEDAQGKPTGTAKPYIANSIIWKNKASTAPLLRNINGTPTLSNCLVDADSCQAIHSGVGAGITCITGMIYNKNPLFVDADNGDFHLLPNSPAINAGSNAYVTTQDITLDNDSLPRIVDNFVDIGAWEYNPAIQYPPRVLASPESIMACEKSNITLKTKVTGSLPLFFQWYKNDMAIEGAISDSLIINNITHSDTGSYKCIIKNEANKTAKSENAYIKVKPLLPLSINIATNSQPQCEGDSVLFTINTQNSGASPKIEWLMNNTTVATGNNFSTAVESRWHKYSCKITSSEQCASPISLISNELNFPVETSVTPTISLSSSSKNICEGENIILKTSVQFAGDTPQYQWFINNILINNQDSIYQTTQLKHNDHIKAVLKSSLKCLTKNNIASNEDTILVTARTNVALSIKADKNDICKGDTVIFKAESRGGGNTPQYQWLLNDDFLTEKSDILSISTLKNEDILKAVLTSSERCTVKNTVFSDSIKMSVTEPTMPVLELTATKSVLCKGERIEFVSTGKNLGLNPQYQWFRNGKKLEWDMPHYATDSLRIGDVIQAEVLSSSTCLMDKKAISNIILPKVRLCLDGNAYTDQQVLVYPNPSSDTRVNVGLVNLKGFVRIEVFTQRGQLLLTKIIDNIQEDKEINIEVPELPDGLYMVRVINGEYRTYKRWLVAR